ncbi:MAG: fatty acid desaturase [Methylotenera sp.]|nr:fatty acid desaturase [Oligoflexia bacterium]
MSNIPNFITVTYPEPHIGRAKEIIAAHPEVKELFGHDTTTAWITLGVVALQFGLAFALSNQPIWVIVAVSYLIGAFAHHALFVVIHECAHNLVFKTTRANTLWGIFTNLPMVFPSSVSFKKYHLMHHRHQGKFNLDADLPNAMEEKIFGGSALGKATWLLFFMVIEGVVRPARVKAVQLWDGMTFAAVAFEIAAMAALIYFTGWHPFLYLLLSTLFSIGLHPVGARWIQEHFVFHEKQETYSYYGPINKICLNVGYHNEHHDLVRVPWSKLPELKRMAPEFYDTLYSHSSWTKLLFKFLFDPTVTFDKRVVRPG